MGMLGMHGTYWANMAMCEADLIFAIGARFDDRVTGRLDAFAENAETIIPSTSIHPTSGKNVRTDIPIVGDVKTVLRSLISAHRQEGLGDRPCPWLEDRRWLG
jgi:acetolactate synthase-1/2/3 large subunit